MLKQIAQEEAKEMMDKRKVIILGVRERDEYASSYIYGAILLLIDAIDEETSVSALAKSGYTNIYEFCGLTPGSMTRSCKTHVSL